MSATGFFTLVDEVLVTALDKQTTPINELLSITSMLGFACLTVWVVWHGYSILVGTKEGTLGPFLQEALSKYMFLCVAVGIGFSSTWLINRSRGLQDGLTEMFNKHFASNSGGTSSGNNNSNNSVFANTDSRINEHLRNASTYISAKVADLSEDGIKKRAQDCIEFDSAFRTNKDATEAIKLAQGCYNLIMVSDNSLKGTGVTKQNVEEALKYLESQNIRPPRPFVLPNPGESWGDRNAGLYA